MRALVRADDGATQSFAVASKLKCVPVRIRFYVAVRAEYADRRVFVREHVLAIRALDEMIGPFF